MIDFMGGNVTKLQDSEGALQIFDMGRRGGFGINEKHFGSLSAKLRNQDAAQIAVKIQD